MKAWMSSNFGKFATELRPLIDVRIWFLLNILKTNRPIKTKFCIHIIIDKIYVDIVNHCFSQICKRVTALDQCSHSNFKLGVFIPPMYKICGYEVKFTGMTFYLEKVIGRNGHGPI